MSTHSKIFPAWALFSLAANGLLALAIASLLWHESQGSVYPPVSNLTMTTHVTNPKSTPAPQLGERLQLNYQQWVALLKQEAEVVATKQPEHLAILIGDSLSLWFPPEQLPSEKNWLNQGISGETSAGLLNRLDLLDETQPEVIFVMIGINDLIRGVRSETVLANQQMMIRYLQRVHPQAKIVIQSVLPHSADKATWEGRDRLLALPNSRIRELNKQLKAIAKADGVIYLDLYSLFADNDGNLKTELSTDGLHLSTQGYLVWSNALRVFNQLVLEPQASS
ncbi:MAG TPA: SGNH/GDSL hydrolase family protein [Coleofasciculaceae cyanobacterium]